MIFPIAGGFMSRLDCLWINYISFDFFTLGVSFKPTEYFIIRMKSVPKLIKRMNFKLDYWIGTLSMVVI